MAFGVAAVPHLRHLPWEFRSRLPADTPAQQARAPPGGLGQIIKATQPHSFTPETLSSPDPPVPSFLLPLPLLRDCLLSCFPKRMN